MYPVTSEYVKRKPILWQYLTIRIFISSTRPATPVVETSFVIGYNYTTASQGGANESLKRYGLGTLLSGQKSKRINWLELSSKSERKSNASSTLKNGQFLDIV